LTFQPVLGLFAMALGTVSIPTGMIGIPELPAVIALRHMAAKERGAAVLDVAHRALLAGEQRVPGPIGRTVLAEDVRHLDHANPGFTDRASVR
jgi:hypothetical protein